MTALTEPQPGDLGCVSIKGDVGWLIRLGQFLCLVNWRPWTWRQLWKRARSEHVFVYVGNGQIVEAEPRGARLWNLSEYADRPIVWVRCPDQYRAAVATAAMALLETPYGWEDYVALAAHRFGIPILRRVALSTSSMICSTLGVVAARRGGWQLLTPTPAGYVRPDEVAALAA